MTSNGHPSALPSERSADGIVSLQLIPNPEKPRGGVVVLDAWLIGELLKFFNWLDTQPKPTGFLLMSASSRVFVAGADLAEIDALDDDALHNYLQRGGDAFGRIPKLACPSVAVIGGAALGGGLEIAMHCDGLVGVVPPSPPSMDKPYRIGLPEAGLGICPGWGGTLTLPARIDPAIAMKATATGETWKVTEAPAGLLDATASDPDSARAAAIAWLRSHSRTQPLRNPRSVGPGSDAARRALGEVTPIIASSEAGRAVASAIETGLSRGFEAGVAAEQGHLVRLRHTPEARAKLEAFLKKS